LGRAAKVVPTSSPRAFKTLGTAVGDSKVVSIQRLSVGGDMDLPMVRKAFERWLRETRVPLIGVRVEDSGAVQFTLTLTGHHLMGLLPPTRDDAQEASASYVSAGLLAKECATARFEFRPVFKDGTILVALLDFVPRLPWWLYRSTQGIFHWEMMRLFKNWLEANATKLGKDSRDD